MARSGCLCCCVCGGNGLSVGGEGRGGMDTNQQPPITLASHTRSLNTHPPANTSARAPPSRAVGAPPLLPSAAAGRHRACQGRRSVDIGGTALFDSLHIGTRWSSDPCPSCTHACMPTGSASRWIWLSTYIHSFIPPLIPTYIHTHPHTLRYTPSITAAVKPSGLNFACSRISFNRASHSVCIHTHVVCVLHIFSYVYTAGC